MEDPTETVLERITRTLELLTVQQAPRPRVKVDPPTFDGTGDVELFIRQLSDVAAVCEWPDDIVLLQLRNCLRDKAIDCGRANNVDTVIQALQMRFGTSASEAQALLANVRRDHRTSLQEYASYVSRLVNLANPELPIDYRQTMTLRTFKSTLGHVGLQRHLLVANVQTLEDAVRVGAEYLQVGSQATSRQESRVATCDVDDQDYVQVRPVTVDTEEQMLETLNKLMEKVNQLEDKLTEKQKPKLVCFGCGKSGHFRSNCPLKKQGNEKGPRN